MGVVPVRTRRPRLLPAALLASALVVGTGGGVLIATSGSAQPAADACAEGSEFVTVRPVIDSDAWKPGVPAGPSLAGCVNSAQLDKAAEDTAANPRG
jgi:hypothetical protein